MAAAPLAPTTADGNRLTLGLPARAVGAISGTSMDAVDVALLTTDGEAEITRGPALARPYTERERATIRAAMPDAMAVAGPRERTHAMAAAEEVVTEAHGEAIAAFLDRHGPCDVVGWHGQTVAHAPERGVTVQLGDAASLARRLGLPVIADLRLADVAAGGEGAPLVPVYHRALVRAAKLAEPALVINLGGVANVTSIAGDTLVAFDTGPASALIDDAVAERGLAYDDGGAIAAGGTVDEIAVAALLTNPFFAAPPPKSLDRDAFAAPLPTLSFADRIATLTRFSAAALGAAMAHLPAPPASVVAAGGGTRNATLMAMISDALGADVVTADSLGWSDEFMEAEAFAYLAVRAARGLPITFPGTTGVAAPLTGGRVVLPTSG